eukprot:TRINITY_DN6142_c0_g1_i1.p1 TRINITY_DN6142_c0_g1~~TRINITY_DN6142_c0_g1_i1.p1  ORF type:complete len:568 (-),score=119.53 TRINITY_DN6142_c0_g1_i1:2-1666(-)
MDPAHFRSRKNLVLGTKGVVATSQPLASQAGIQILNQGGNAADAAVAVAAVLNVLEPDMTGLGGDAFCLYFDNKTKKVTGLNGSGRSPKNLSLDKIENLQPNHVSFYQLPGASKSPHCVTVPGAAAAWCDTVSKFGSGKLKLIDIFNPAIKIAEEGFPISQLTSKNWSFCETLLKKHENGKDLLYNGERAPQLGEVMKNPHLANVFKELAEKGPDNFYSGRIGQSIVELIQSLGGFLTLEDLTSHKTELIETPITLDYHGVTFYEMPPNGQGLAALLALNILKNVFDKNETSIPYDSAERWHVQLEAMRLAFADARHYICDPAFNTIPISELLSAEYGKIRAGLISREKAGADIKKGNPEHMSNTVYFSIVDEQGNACSFINSIYEPFGSGLVPKNCGFAIQNRGAGFSLNRNHYNRLEGGKRPFHTIIPALAICNDTKELFACFGVKGTFMQAQGHVQVMMNMVNYGMNPQEALDAYRWCIFDGTSNGAIVVEETMDEKVIEKLREAGHKIEVYKDYQRIWFGMGQIIYRHPQTGVYWAGSDSRGDGQAIAQI